MIQSLQQNLESTTEQYRVFPYGIWLPKRNDELIEKIHNVFWINRLDYHNDILYIKDTRVRTPKDPGSHPCYNCGQCIDNGYSACGNTKCIRDRKKRGLCVRELGGRQSGSWIHEIKKSWTYPTTKKGVVFIRIFCNRCRVSFETLGDYKQDNHVIIFRKIQNKDEKTAQRIINSQHDRVPSRALRHECLKRDGWKCCDCGATKDETSLEIDHIIPFSKGGLTVLDNLQTLCKECNRSKNTRTWIGGKT